MSTSVSKKRGFTLLYAMIISSIVLATVLSIIGLALKQRVISGLGENSQLAFYAANSGLECALYWTLQGRDVSVGGDIQSIDLFRIPRDNNTDTAFEAIYDSPLLDTDDTLQNPLRTDSDVATTIPCFEEDILEGADVYGFDTQYDFANDRWMEAVRGNEVFTTIGATLESLCGKGFITESDGITLIGATNFRVWFFRTILPDSSGSVAQVNSCAEVAVCRQLDTGKLAISSRGYNTCDVGASNIVERAVRLTQ